MPHIKRDVVVGAGATVDVNLAPFDRFAGRGGRVSVRATVPIAAVGAGTLTLMAGSDVIADQFVIPVERGANLGPDKDTPSVSGFGVPGDPITVRLQDPGGAGYTAMVEVQVDNA
jgi:hypothetical protein